MLAGKRYLPGDKVELSLEEAEYFAKTGAINLLDEAQNRLANTDGDTAKQITRLEEQLVIAAQTVAEERDARIKAEEKEKETLTLLESSQAAHKQCGEELEKVSAALKEMQDVHLKDKETIEKLEATLKQSVSASEDDTAKAEKTSAAKTANKKT